ncbi:MAG: hypothetical protein K6A34_06225 [Methanobrevibacter sp.]|nr:hypothetical protein [Methanobrevibacter sp.]
MTLDPRIQILLQHVHKKGYPYYANNGKTIKKRRERHMNLLEEQLHNLNVTINAVKKYLENKKNMSYEDWRNAHEYLNSLINRRDKLLSEKFRGDII